MTETSHWYHLLRQVVDDRPVIVAMDVLVGAAATSAQLADLGVTDQLLVAGVRGVGDLDPEVEAAALVLGTAHGVTIMEGIRNWQRVLDDPPDEMLGRIDAFDPDHRAVVVSALFHTGASVAGRPVLGARPAAWQALEDKLTVDALWDAVGVPRAPSRTVELRDADAVMAAARDLDRGQGTCWVADNSTGWHGGGEYLRWTGPTGDPTQAVRDLSGAARHARVMPFLEGRPCSIHGWVFDDHVAALRPCEMVVWRDEDGRFVYGGASTTWEPAPADRERMRSVARDVGAHLRATVGYRGTFSIDGVLTAEGFRPTELNPRFGGGLGRVGAGIDLPLYLLHLATVSRPDLDWRPRDLEDAVLAAADATPTGRVMVPLPAEAQPGSWRLVQAPDGTWVDAPDPDGEADAVIEVGPSVTSGQLAMVHLPGLPRGASAAVLGSQVVPALGARVGVALGRLEAAMEPSRP